MAIFSAHVLAGLANISPVYHDKSTLSRGTVGVVKATGDGWRGQRALGSYDGASGRPESHRSSAISVQPDVAGLLRG